MTSKKTFWQFLLNTNYSNFYFMQVYVHSVIPGVDPKMLSTISIHLTTEINPQPGVIYHHFGRVWTCYFILVSDIFSLVFLLFFFFDFSIVLFQLSPLAKN